MRAVLVAALFVLVELRRGGVTPLIYLTKTT